MRRTIDGSWKQNNLYEKAIDLSSGYTELK